MQELAKAKYQIKRQEWSREKALEFFLKKGEKYKVEIIKKIPKDEFGGNVAIPHLL